MYHTQFKEKEVTELMHFIGMQTIPNTEGMNLIANVLKAYKEAGKRVERKNIMDERKITKKDIEKITKILVTSIQNSAGNKNIADEEAMLFFEVTFISVKGKDKGIVKIPKGTPPKRVCELLKKDYNAYIKAVRKIVFSAESKDQPNREDLLKVYEEAINSNDENLQTVLIQLARKYTMDRKELLLQEERKPK